MFTLIVFLPLAGCLLAGLFGHLWHPRVSEIVTSALLCLSALLSWIGFFQIGSADIAVTKIALFEWIDSGAFSAGWALRIDALTAVMLVVVTSVSALVHVYSIGYMHHDPHRPRFFAYLSLFTFAMLALVSADNLLQMFFGWEGVGLASYLLIGFWFKRPQANAAAIKAFVVNRVGDFGFMLGILLLFALFGTIDLDRLFAAIAAAHSQGAMLVFPGISIDPGSATTLACLLLFMGAMGKSAQFLLHTWLPDAMEGPTPVSALIHAATMVTAGVFMVARLSPIFEYSQSALTFVTATGALTAIFAASVGLVQNDIKRVIAYSTCSQLGYMFVALGVGGYSIAIFHLFTHAFFKALLFLGAGSVIHAVADEQDMRAMGGLRRAIPFTYIVMLIGTLSLTGFPLLAGFYSKDAIIEAAFVSGNAAAGFAFWATLVAAVMTSFYSWRLIFMTFHGPARAPVDVMSHIHESPPVMCVPLALLAFGAVFAGMAGAGIFIGDGYGPFWKGVLATGPDNTILAAIHQVPIWVKVMPAVMMLAGLMLAFHYYIRRPRAASALAEQHRPLYLFLLNKWYVDEIYNFLFIRPALRLGRILWKCGDGQIIDGLGPDGVSRLVRSIGARAARLQSGYIYHYALAMIVGAAALLSWAMLGTGAS